MVTASLTGLMHMHLKHRIQLHLWVLQLIKCHLNLATVLIITLSYPVHLISFYETLIALVVALPHEYDVVLIPNTIAL